MENQSEQPTNEKLKWVEDLYSGKDREFGPPPDDEGYSFFDIRFHDLAVRWYRIRFLRGEARDQALPN